MGDTVTYGRCKWCGLICDCPHPLKTVEEFNEKLEEEIKTLNFVISHHSQEIDWRTKARNQSQEHLDYWLKYKKENNIP